MASAPAARFAGRYALVTGGASGFGAGIVKRLAEEGAAIAIVDRDYDKAAALARELGAPAVALHADVSCAESVSEMAVKLFGAFPRLDVLVNNAGIGQRPTPLEELSVDLFEELFAVNARSVFLTARAFVPSMKRAGGGAILNVASTGGVRPRPKLSWYNATKGWMIAATRAVRRPIDRKPAQTAQAPTKSANGRSRRRAAKARAPNARVSIAGSHNTGSRSADMLRQTPPIAATGAHRKSRRSST